MSQTSLVQQFQDFLVTAGWWEWAAYLVAALVGIICIILFVVLFIIVFIFLERRLLGRFQARLGPNRVGPEGIFQAFADAVKVLTKEDVVPSNADKVLHWLGPVIAFVPIVMIFAVIPIADRAFFTDLNIGILYIVAISTLSVIGVFMAAWASNNKYSFVAALRTIAQMVSYELPVALCLISVVVMVGSLSINEIVEYQAGVPFFLLQPLAFIIFFLGTSAEINRAPFDLLEADSEIVAGVHTEYSGMKFALFYLGEYGHALSASAIIATVFLGGWEGPVLPPILWFLIKLLVVFFIFIWVRATMPRIRVDQLTAFAWKAMLPLAVFNLILVTLEKVLFPGVFPWFMVVVNIIAAAVLIFLWSKAVSVRGGRVEV